MPKYPTTVQKQKAVHDKNGSGAISINEPPSIADETKLKGKTAQKRCYDGLKDCTGCMPHPPVSRYENRAHVPLFALEQLCDNATVDGRSVSHYVLDYSLILLLLLVAEFAINKYFETVAEKKRVVQTRITYARIST